MDSLIDKIAEQVYAQIEEKLTPDQQMSPELQKLVKALAVKAEEHQDLNKKAMEFIQMVKDGDIVPNEFEAKDVQDLLKEGKKENEQVMKLIKTGKPENIQQAANIITKQLDKQAQQIKNKLIPNIQNTDENTLKTVVGTLQSFITMFKMARFFPQLIVQNTQKQDKEQPDQDGMNADEEAMRELTQLLIKEAGDTPVAQRTLEVYQKLSMGKLQDPIQAILKKWNENGGQNWQGVVKMSVQAWQNSGEKEADPEEKGEEEQGEMEDPELWDPSPEIKDAFTNAYNQFRQRFYRVRKLLDQGKLVAALKQALEAMSEDEEGEAAIERYSDEDAPPTEEKPTANESQRPGQISEGFLKWLMISKATDLVLESMNEADADVVDKVMKDRDAARKKVGMDDKAEEPEKSTDDAPEEGEEIPKKDLQNIQADVESFYQNALKMRDGLDKIADAAKAGKADFSRFKNAWMKQASEIQDDIVELYNDLINLSPPKKKLDEQEEGEEQKEISDMDRVEKAKMLQKVYDRITDQLAPIAKALDSKKDLPYYRMAEPVEQSLKSLNTVLQIFPSVQAFKGGTADDMIKGYDSMMSDLDILTKLFQRLIKSGEMSSLTIRNLYKGLVKFSKGLEDLFNVKSKIEDKPAPEAAEKPADAEDKPEDEEASDEKDTDGDEFPDEEEEQAGTDPEDPEDVPADADDDGASDAAEEEAGTDPEDPQSKPDEDKEFNINSPQAAETHIKKVMPYSDFQRMFSNSDVTVDQYNALMLLYLLSKYEAPKQEQEKKGFDKDPLSVATRKSESFFGFSKDKVNDNLIRLRTLNKPAFDSLLSFFNTALPTEMRRFSNLMNKRMKLKPFTVSAAPNKLVSDSTAPQFADSGDIKKANAEEPPKPKKQKPKNPMLDLAPDQKELSKIYRERLIKKLKPIVENLLRGING